jgi:uncharacterized protein (DUF849 family)
MLNPLLRQYVRFLLGWPLGAICCDGLAQLEVFAQQHYMRFVLIAAAFGAAKVKCLALGLAYLLGGVVRGVLTFVRKSFCLIF